MVRAGDVLENPATGERFTIRATPVETGGALASFEAAGRPGRFGTREHVHSSQEERYEVLSGAIGLTIGRRRTVLRAGDRGVVPPRTPHRLFGVDGQSAEVRFELRPALRTLDFLERYVEPGRTGRFNRWGLPPLLPGAVLAREFADVGYATRPPPAVQRVVLGAIASLARRLEALPAEYAWVDEWDVDAPRDAVWDALADARSYPDWWRPVYLEAESDGPPAVGRTSRQRFRGRLPYTLRTSSTLVRLDRPRELVADVTGDLAGRGAWTLTEVGGRTHVRFVWRVRAERPFIRALTPLLRPAFSRNHAWAVARAREGLEPYARAQAGSGERPG